MQPCPWLIAGIVVALPMVSRPVCLQVLARLVVKGTNSGSRLWLARRMAEDLAADLPVRTIRVVHARPRPAPARQVG